MLAVSPLRNDAKDESKNEMVDSFYRVEGDGFSDFSGENFLQGIDFNDLLVGIGNDGDELPDLEMDPVDLFSEFAAGGGTDQETERNESEPQEEKEEHGKSKASNSCKLDSGQNLSQRGIADLKEANKVKKSSAQSKNPQGKRKVKVDWTPELHRRFVQAVEQLGVDKAVPSRILELMGTDFLTRHNIASHLQKYRSHKKHLLAREAEAASWNQRRQIMYGGGAPKGGRIKADSSQWMSPPTIGFPPMTPLHHFRPIHVWGHPFIDHSLMHSWPNKNVPAPPPTPPSWPPPADPSFWHAYHHRRFPGTLVPGIPPHVVYKGEAGVGGPTAPASTPLVPFKFHPSNESVDAAIRDVLAKPWSPLPLGLKPPSLDSVLEELQSQGISCASDRLRETDAED